MPINKPSIPEELTPSKRLPASKIKLLKLKSIKRQAKYLQRAARSERPSQSLPVLRRLILSKTIKQISLVELHRRKGTVQRKHILNMLAREANYENWAEFSVAIESHSTDNWPITDFESLQEIACLKLWFSSLKQAEEYASNHGGRAFAMGRQAVVLN